MDDEAAPVRGRLRELPRRRQSRRWRAAHASAGPDRAPVPGIPPRARKMATAAGRTRHLPMRAARSQTVHNMRFRARGPCKRHARLFGARWRHCVSHTDSLSAIAGAYAGGVHRRYTAGISEVHQGYTPVRAWAGAVRGSAVSHRRGARQSRRFKASILAVSTFARALSSSSLASYRSGPLASGA